MALALPYTIINGDPVDAGPVQSNYHMIESYTNQEVIDRSGTVAMNAQLKLVGNPVAALDAAPKQYVDQQLPIGVVMMFGGTTAPAGGIWLLCDNTEYQATTYPELATVMGATAGRFRVPDLMNRLPVGGGGAYAHHSTGGSADAIIPAHSHTIDHGHGNTGYASNDHTHTAPDHHHGWSGTTDQQGAHNHYPSGDPSVNLIGAAPSGAMSFTFDIPPDYATAAFRVGYYGITTTNGAHAHNISGNTNWASQQMGGYQQTGGISANHDHSVPAMNGSSGQTGVAPAGQNLPPYYAIAFIIKAK